MTPDVDRLIRRHLGRETSWRPVQKHSRTAGIDPGHLGGRGIGIHSLLKTASTTPTATGPP
jgi:hypothetical protein